MTDRKRWQDFSQLLVFVRNKDLSHSPKMSWVCAIFKYIALQVQSQQMKLFKVIMA